MLCQAQVTHTEVYYELNACKNTIPRAYKEEKLNNVHVFKGNHLFFWVRTNCIIIMNITQLAICSIED